MLHRIPKQAENKEYYTLEGRKRLAGLMEHNIGLYDELKTVQKLRWQNMTVHITGRHTVQWSDLKYFTNAGLPYVEAVCRRYLADNTKPLWWIASALSSTAKSVVRSKATTRLNVAFKQALHNAGYDTQGKRLPDQGKQPQSGSQAIKQLFGTLVIKSHAPAEIQKMPFRDLQRYCARIVHAAEEALGPRPGDAAKGSKAGAAPRQQDFGRPGSGNRGGRGGLANKAGGSTQRRPQRDEHSRRKGNIQR